MTEQESAERPGMVRRLEPAVVAKIAAGEMILRPLSVAKELLENALDAGSTRIRLEIREAADRYLSVTDDGAGMDRDACTLSVERHATSKIVAADDIDEVETLGFRGEALASIARVSRLRIVTSPDGEEGTELIVRGGEIEAIRPAGRARGTTVEVEDLFFNSPVRKRFLRSPSGETRLINRMLGAYGLSRPEVDFRLVVDGKENLVLTPADPDERVEQVYGAGFRKKVLPLRGENPRIGISGWVGIPEIARTGTQGQTILVNGRWVSHPALGHALRQGFGDLIPATKQPFAVLVLEVPGGSVDVNIHPTKREIRFVDDRIVFAEVVRTVREAVRTLVPGLAEGDRGWGASHHAAIVRDAGSQGGGRLPSGTRPDFDLLFQPVGSDRERIEPLPTPTRPDGGEAEEDGSPIPPVPLWQLQERYIVAQTRQGLLIIDQHAAHERILYERALRSLAGDSPTSQQLLFPVVVELDQDEQGTLEENGPSLSRLGIDLEPFGGAAVILRAVPATWEGDPKTQLRELLQDVAQRTRRSEERTQALAASFACHSAVRSGAKLDLDSMNRLVDELFSTETPHGDPHGRPTYVVLSVEELDRRFGRTG